MRLPPHGGALRPSWASAAVRCGVLVALSTPLAPQQLTARLRDAPNLKQLIKQHSLHGDSFNSFHYGAFWSTAQRLAKRSTRWTDANPNAITPVCQQTAEALPTLEPRTLAMISYSLAKGGYHRGEPWDALWEVLPAVAGANVEAMNMQELANTAWAFAKAKRRSRHLFEAIATEGAARVTRRRGEVSARHGATLLWAFATARVEAPHLFDAVATHTTELGGHKAQEMTNLAWAYATLGVRSPELFQRIADEASKCQVFFFFCTRRLGYERRNSSNASPLKPPRSRAFFFPTCRESLGPPFFSHATHTHTHHSCSSLQFMKTHLDLFLPICQKSVGTRLPHMSHISFLKARRRVLIDGALFCFVSTYFCQ